MVKISIIIPVFNSEKLLRKCFDSICEQTFTDFEVIVVNDGSTDGSGQICDKYAENDRRFKIFHKKNEGVSIARNIGIEKSNGQYITFIDSDDWVNSDYLQNLIDGTSQNCDLVVCGIVCNYSNNTEKRLEIKTDKFSSFEPTNLHNLIKSRLIFGPCNKLFDAQIIKQNGIKFPDSISYGEDRIFNYQYIKHTLFIQTLADSGYHYYHSGTNTLSSISRPNMFELEYSQWELLNNVYRDKNAFNIEVQRDQHIDLFWIIHDNIFANRNRNSRKLYKYIKHLLNTQDIDNIRVFANDIKYNKIIKYSILHRNSILLYLYIQLLNICKR